MNDMRIFFGVLAGFSLLAWPLLVLLHELGHAVPALLLTRAPVTVYLGSYGDRSNSWRVQLGPLEFYLKRGWWAKGLCVHTGHDLSTAKKAVIVLGGVLVSVLVAGLSFYGALAFDLHGALKLLLFFLVIYALVSVVTNLVPSQRGGLANDGLLLKQLLTGRTAPATTFAPELLELIAQSREVAIDLGYSHISTLHLLLADCAMPYRYSLANLFFPNPDERAAFYERQRVGPADAAAGSLPLTTEFEQALQRAYLAGQHGFCQMLYPCHLLVAASEVAGSELAVAVAAPASLPQQLLAYYRQFAELWAH